MTRVLVGHDEDGNVCSLQACGHAGSASHGEDIVCAGISALMITAARAATKFGAEAESDEDRAQIAIRLTGGMDRDAYKSASLILTAIVDGLFAMEEQYAQYITMTEV